MSETLDKAKAAVAKARGYSIPDPGEDHDRTRRREFYLGLMDAATVNASIANAEANERIATALERIADGLSVACPPESR